MWKEAAVVSMAAGVYGRGERSGRLRLWLAALSAPFELAGKTRLPKTLITGAAGFIGAHLSRELLARGHEIVGIDNLNDYYDPGLKHARLEWIGSHPGFVFERIDVADPALICGLVQYGCFDTVVHLAAQAGVRYSLTNPLVTGQSNLIGHLNILEAVRRADPSPFLVYASSSSVYGNNTPAPFREDAPVDSPVSLYAATKRAAELMSESYTNLFCLKQIGLRFFTVYGPWGRPDMAYWKFASKILRGDPIDLFNNGALERDFTWIGDIVDGIVKVVEGGPDHLPHSRSHRIYNIGNNNPVRLTDFVSILEARLGKQASKRLVPMQPGDVYRTAADIGAIRSDYGFEPSTSLRAGLGLFCDWFSTWTTGVAAPVEVGRPLKKDSAA